MSRTHGNAATYRAGCRCDDCREANRVRSVAERARRAARSRDEVPHGTAGGYSNWGCRCERCTAANSAKCAAAYGRRKKAAAAVQLRDGAVVIAVILGVTAGMCGTFAGIEAHRHLTRPPAVQPAPAPRANPSPVLTSTGGAA